MIVIAVFVRQRCASSVHRNHALTSFLYEHNK